MCSEFSKHKILILYQAHLLSLVDRKGDFKNHSNKGFTIPEILVILFIVGILAAIGLPSLFASVEIQRLNKAQNEVYNAMRQAQSQANKEKLSWQASFREQSGIVQWAVHPITVNPSAAYWNDLDGNVRLDSETTLQQSSGVRRIQFDYQGNVRQPPLGRITLSSKYVGKVKRCVYVSTILGAMRTAKERSTANSGGDYCY